MTPRTAATFSPPVMEARRWLEGVHFDADRPLINVSHASGHGRCRAEQR